MIFKELFVVGLLVNCFALSVIRAADDCKSPTATFNQLTLCEEFQMIRDLAPHDSVIRLVQSHMQNDIRFRKAADYMLTSDFKKTTAKIDATATYQNLLKKFVRAGVNTTDIDSIAKIFDCILIPIIKEAITDSRSAHHSEQMVESRSLSSFVQEFSRLIPPDELIDTLETQVAKNKQFAEFYEIVRNPTFRNQVMSGFYNRDVARYIKQLRRRQIYLSELVESGFDLLYLGPEVDV